MEIFLMIAGGLGLFLYAVSNLSDTLKELLTNKAKQYLHRFTKNTISGIITGILITVILDSSSAVIIMTIVLVNCGALSFRQAMGIVMGANIGTTFSSQLIALDIGRFSPVPIVIGLILSMIARNERISKTGRLLLYFGILFFGLYTMERAVEPLRGQPQFSEWMSKLENPVQGSLTGAVITLIIQSSSATLGIVITLAKKGLISLSGAIAVMLGAELGTCADILLATIKSNRQALRTGMFHLFFNVVSILIGLMAFPLFVQFILTISGNTTLDQQVANAHMLFNSLGVLIFLPFLPLIERMLLKWVPDKVAMPAPIPVKESPPVFARKEEVV